MADPEIHISPAARREIRKLTDPVRRKVVGVIESLKSFPRPVGVEKLAGRPDYLRLTIGRDHRVIYHIRSSLLIVILVVRDRKEAYRGLDTLDRKLAAAITEIASTAEGVRLLATG